MTTIKPDNQGLWQARATMWELLALSFRYPEDTLIEAITAGEWIEAAGELVEALDLVLPEKFTTDVATNDHAAGTEALLHSLRAEATRLFIGAPEPTCNPYEGVWRAQDDGVQALLFVNPHSMEVERFTKACGLGRPEGTNEPLDHVATECELLQYLASLAAGIVEAPKSAPNLADLPGSSPQAAYEQFLREHVRAWAPRFCKAVIAETRHPFYRSAAILLELMIP